jgi:hypothetical protein
MKKSSLPFLAVIVVAIPAAHAATVIYEQSFTPGAGTAGLNGTTPTTGANNWVASNARFQADGDILEGGTTTSTAAGSATLSFAPANGLVYTLDASFRNAAGTVNAATPNENDWFALGFAKGQSTGQSTGDRFININVIGKAWMLFRAANTANVNNATQLGSATVGNTSSADWSDPTLAATYGGGMDMRVVLDTTGGAGAWTATWFAKLPASGSFTEVRAATALLDEDINSVGVAISGRGVDGDLSYFRLTSVPEPGTALLGGLGLLALLRRRCR